MCLSSALGPGAQAGAMSLLPAWVCWRTTPHLPARLWGLQSPWTPQATHRPELGPPWEGTPSLLGITPCPPPRSGGTHQGQQARAKGSSGRRGVLVLGFSRGSGPCVFSFSIIKDKLGAEENSGSSDRFYFLGLQNHYRQDCSLGIKRHLLLGRKAMTNLY